MVDSTDEPLVSLTEAGPLAHENAEGALKVQTRPPEDEDEKATPDGGASGGEVDDTAAAPSA